MEKLSLPDTRPAVPHGIHDRTARWRFVLAALYLIILLNTLYSGVDLWKRVFSHDVPPAFPYGRFPQAGDPFQFLPCTNATRPPDLADARPADSWAQLYEPDPSRWSWGNATETGQNSNDPYAGRGIYLCGYLDVPLDWTNASQDGRIVRLAVTKFQAGGPTAGRSARTLVVEPGGPGGSGTSYVWRAGERLTQRLSGGQLDVLGWDPRGVNTTQPAAACFPYDADRDRWWQLTHQYRSQSVNVDQLSVADAMGEATMRACWERLGDLGRFVGTGMVARDLDAIRTALAEPELTGYLVSYGTGIGQTYANMFPDRVGRIVLDGTEFVPDEWQLGGFGWASLDNVTDAWHDGFLGECVAAGPVHCALAAPIHDSLQLPAIADLEDRMAALLADLRKRPVAATSAASGASLVTYSALVAAIYASLYQPRTWPHMAAVLADLERGNASRAATTIDGFVWQYDPAVASVSCSSPSSPFSSVNQRPSTDELSPLVICADAFDAPLPPDGLHWWDGLWANMTNTSWISGNSRFYNVLPCRHYTTFWPEPVGVYRGPLNHTLAHPVLLVAETYDPATPLRNGHRLAAAMGPANARLIVHHGYGHSSNADPSDCTDAVARAFILHGRIPDALETDCYANEKPYVYGIDPSKSASASASVEYDSMAVWRDHMREMMLWNPDLVRQRV